MGKYFKEIIIGILLVIVIIILLVISFYEYTPDQKTISDVEEYKRSEETSKVIDDINSSTISTVSKESIITSYSISAADLTGYQYKTTYNKGRGNPFATVKEEETVSDTTGGSSGGSGSSSSSATSTTITENTSSTGYFNSTGKNK